MSKVFRLILILCVPALLMGCGQKEKSETEIKEFHADSYSVYSIPVENNAKYKAFNPAGDELDIWNGCFCVTECGTYTYEKMVNGKTTSYKLVVTDQSSPDITVSYSKKYVAKGALVELPDIRVSDSDGTKDYTVSVSYNETLVPVTDGSFSVKETGDYIITINATDKSGNETNRQVVVVGTTDNQLTNCIYEMDTNYGLEQQTSTPIGIRLQRSEEKDPSGHGVAKLKLVTARTPNISMAMLEHEMFFTAPFINEWTENFSSIYFYVKNVSDTTYYLDFLGQEIDFNLENGATTRHLTKDMGWQKVEISNLSEFLTQDGASFAGMIDMEDCVGMYLGVKQVGTNYQYGELLMSSIYGTPKNTK